MTYKHVWLVQFFTIWITCLPFGLQALESCSDIDPNDIQRFYGPPPTDVDPASLPLELRCASVNEPIVFLPTQEAAEKQRAILELHGMGTSPAFQESHIGVIIQIVPAIVERPPLKLSFCLDVGNVCEPLLVWDSHPIPGRTQEQVGYTDFITTQKVSRTGAKSIYVSLLLPPDLVDHLRSQVSIPRDYLIRASVADSTQIDAIGIEVATVAIVDLPEDDATPSTGRVRNASRVRSDQQSSDQQSSDQQDSDQQSSDQQKSNEEENSGYTETQKGLNTETSAGVSALVQAIFEKKFSNDIITPYLTFGGKAGAQFSGDTKKIGVWILGQLGLEFNFLGGSPYPFVYAEYFIGKDFEESKSKPASTTTKKCAELSPKITLKILDVDVSEVIELANAMRKKCKNGKRTRSMDADAQVAASLSMSARAGYGYSFDVGPFEGSAFVGGEGTVGIEGTVIFPMAPSFEVANLGPFAKLAAIAEAKIDLGIAGGGFGAELELIKEHFVLDTIIHLDDKPMVGMIKNILEGPYGKVYVYGYFLWVRKEYTFIEWDSELKRTDILKIWPERLAEVSGQLHYTSLSSIGAACTYDKETNGEDSMLFEGQYFAKYDKNFQAVYGYPKVIPMTFPGLWMDTLTGGIDACVNAGDGKIHFFRGGEYIQFDEDDFVVKRSFIANEFPNLSQWGFSDIDAVFKGAGNILYFFKGSEYQSTRMSSPSSIASGFPEVGANVTAALKIGDMIYFFKGSDYLVYDPKQRKVVDRKSTQEGFTVDTSLHPESYKPYTPPPPPKCARVYDKRLKPDMEPLPISWKEASTDMVVPEDAFEAAINRDGSFIYVCRADEKTVGQLTWDGCNIIAKGIRQNYEVLLGSTSLSWRFASEGKRLAGAVKGNICRARYGSRHYIGHVDKGCKISVDGVEKTTKHYEMLING